MSALNFYLLGVVVLVALAAVLGWWTLDAAARYEARAAAEQAEGDALDGWRQWGEAVFFVLLAALAWAALLAALGHFLARMGGVAR